MLCNCITGLVGLHLHDGDRERIAMTHTHTHTHENVLKCCFMYLPHFDYYNLFPCLQRKIALISILLRKFQQYLENGIDFKSKLFKTGMVYFTLNLSFFQAKFGSKKCIILLPITATY